MKAAKALKQERQTNDKMWALVNQLRDLVESLRRSRSYFLLTLAADVKALLGALDGEAISAEKKDDIEKRLAKIMSLSVFADALHELDESIKADEAKSVSVSP